MVRLTLVPLSSSFRKVLEHFSWDFKKKKISTGSGIFDVFIFPYLIHEKIKTYEHILNFGIFILNS